MHRDGFGSFQIGLAEHLERRKGIYGKCRPLRQPSKLCGPDFVPTEQAKIPNICTVVRHSCPEKKRAGLSLCWSLASMGPFRPEVLAD